MCLLDLDPDALTVIAVTTARFAPAIPLAFLPAPIVGHYAQLQGRLVNARLRRLPTIAVFIANDSGGKSARTLGEARAGEFNVRSRMSGGSAGRGHLPYAWIRLIQRSNQH